MNKGELYYLARRLKQHAEQAIGARPGQVESIPVRDQLVLGAVLEAPASAVGEIARRLSMAQSAVSAAVVALRKSGLVVTSVDSNDGRVTRVSPSEKFARWARNNLDGSIDDVLDTLLGGMTAEEQACVRRALGLLHRALSARNQVRSTTLAAGIRLEDKEKRRDGVLQRFG